MSITGVEERWMLDGREIVDAKGRRLAAEVCSEEIGRQLAAVPELLEALEDICSHHFTYAGAEADTAEPTSLYNRVNRGRALLLKLAGAATGRRKS